MFNKLNNIWHSTGKCDLRSKKFDDVERNEESCSSIVSYEPTYSDDEGDCNDSMAAAVHENSYYKPAPIGGLQDPLTAKTLRLKMGPSHNSSNSNPINYSFCSESSDDSTASFGSYHLNSLQDSCSRQPQRRHHSEPTPNAINNLIVFDWDNTLFPTKLIREMSESSKRNRICKRNHNRNANHSKAGPIACKISMAQLHETILNSKDYEELSSLSDLIYNVLSTYIERYGANSIRIVTASEKGWIQSSLLMVANIGSFKRIYNLIFIENVIEIIHPLPSQLPFSTQPHLFEYKYRVFCALLKGCNFSKNTNTFISIGDGLYEFEASKLAAAAYPNLLYVDRIKFIQNPSLQDMKDEMNLLLTFCGVFEYTSQVDKKNITIDYERERKQRRLHCK